MKRFQRGLHSDTFLYNAILARTIKTTLLIVRFAFVRTRRRRLLAHAHAGRHGTPIPLKKPGCGALATHRRRRSLALASKPLESPLAARSCDAICALSASARSVGRKFPATGFRTTRPGSSLCLRSSSGRPPIFVEYDGITRSQCRSARHSHDRNAPTISVSL